MTEMMIEKIVETVIDCLDRELLANKITQEKYDAEILKIDQWANKAYKELN